MRRKYNIVVLAAWMTIACEGAGLVGTTGSTGAGREIRIRARAYVGAGAIRLGDVAEVKGQTGAWVKQVRELVLGGSSAGMMGVEEINRALEKAGLVPASFTIYGSRRCKIVRVREDAREGGEVEDKAGRPGRTASAGGAGPGAAVDKAAAGAGPKGSGRTIAAALEEKVAAMTGLPRGALRMDWRCSRPAVLQMPAEGAGVRIVPRGPVGLGSVQFGVIINEGHEKQREGVLVQRKRAREIRVTGNVYYLCASVVAARGLRAGQVIGPEDVRLQARRVTRRDEVGLERPEEVIGQEAARNIRANQVIEREMLRKLRLIKRNDEVEVSTQVGGVRIRFRGQALSGGGMGDPISVRRGPEGPVVRGRVCGVGRVRVGAGGTSEGDGVGGARAEAGRRGEARLAGKFARGRGAGMRGMTGAVGPEHIEVR